MKFKKSMFILFFALTLVFIPLKNLYAGFSPTINETDTGDYQLVGFFDLRDRETSIQITNSDSFSRTVHIQLFDISNNCNENNFFDGYTPNDTHVYNMRDIVTNDTNPSGVVLPQNAYGIFVATFIFPSSPPSSSLNRFFGNQRIEDNNGYEYRTNLSGIGLDDSSASNPQSFTFNFNSESGVILSDVVGIQLDGEANPSPDGEVFAADIVNIWTSWDIDIYDTNEVPFSCRNVVFACTDQNNPLLEALLENSGQSVASIEYGINEAIPHSKGSELLCPNNVITDGFVRLLNISEGDDTGNPFVLYVGLNNGNGRGSMDALWFSSGEL